MPTNISRIKRMLATLVMPFITVLTAFAQYPVQVQPQIISPASLSLSDYYSGSTPKMIVTLTNRDLQQNTLQVRLRVSISNNEVLLTTNESMTYTPIELSPGVPKRLIMDDLEQYLNPNNLRFQGLSKQQYLSQGQLPEGLYSFCFEVVEVPTNRVLSQQGQCAMSWISLTEPPLLNMPADNERITEKPSQFVTFNWTPRHLTSPNGALNTQYQFELVELLDHNVNQNAAFVSSRVLYRVTQTTPSLIYGPGQPLLIPGKRYGWRVRLVPIDLAQDYDKFRNNGFSDIYSFFYTSDCPKPAFEMSSMRGKIVNLSWNKCKDVETYQIKYRPKNLPNAIPKFTTVNGLSTSIGGLRPNTEYVFWITYICSDGSEILSEEISLNTPPLGAISSAPGDGSDSSTNAADVIASQSVGVSGMVRWAFAGGQPTAQINLPSTNATFEEKEALIEPTDISQAKPLGDAEIKLFIINDDNRDLVEMVEADEQGNYSFSVIKEDGTYELEVSHPTGFFKPHIQEITPKHNGEGFTIDVDPVLLIANSMEVSPSIYSPSLSNEEIQKLKIDVLIETNAWDRSYGKINGQMTYSGLSTLKHNNKSYNIITTLEQDEIAPALLQTSNALASYYYRIYGPGFNEQFIPAGSLKTPVLLKKTYAFDKVTYSLSGTVKQSGNAMEQAKVEVKVPVEAMMGDAQSGTERGNYHVFILMTDETGAYHVDLPRLKKGTNIDISMFNYALSPQPFTGQVKVANETKLVYDFDISSNTYSYVGRVVDENGFALANALIKLDGARNPVRTTRYGFFLIQGNYSMSDMIRITADGYDEYSIPVSNFKLAKLDLKKNADTKWGKAILSASSIQEFSKKQGIPTFTSGYLVQGKGQETISDLYREIRTTSDEVVGGWVDMANVTLKAIPSPVDLFVKVKGQADILDAEVEIISNGKPIARLHSKKGEGVRYIGKPGRYKVIARSIEGGTTFCTSEATFDLGHDPDEVPSVTLEVDKGVQAKFKIISSKKEKPLKGAQINVEGIDVKATSDKNGICNALIPMGSATSVKVAFELEKHNSEEKMLTIDQLNGGTITFKLEEIFSEPVTTISGFDVQVTKQVVPDASQPNLLLVSGKMAIPENDVFSPMPDADSIEFKNAAVQILDHKGNAVATDNISFEEATVQMKVYGGIPIEVEGVYLTQLEDAEDFNKAVIKGARAKTVFASASYASAPILGVLRAMPYDAYLLDSVIEVDNYDKPKEFEVYEFPDPEGVPLTSLINIAVSKDVNINSLQDSKIFQVHFDKPENDNSDSLGIPLFGEVSLGLNPEDVIIDSEAMKMKGFLQIPKGMSQLADSNGKMTMDVFNIRNDLSSIDIGFDISETKPYTMQLQKINTEITNIGVEGLGSVNCGVTLGGKVWLTKQDTTSTQDSNGVLNIVSLSFVNKAEGVTLGGEFQLPEKGFSIKGLTFKTDGDKTIAMAYNFAENTFELTASGILEYNSNSSQGGSPDTASSSKVFPLEIQTFALKTADWSLFLAARPNKEIDFGVVTVSVEAVIVSIGYDANMDQMAAMLMNGEITEIPVNMGDPDALVEESKSDWIVGFRGGVQFPIRSIKVEAKATVLIGVVNDEFEFKVSQIQLGIEAAAFKMTAGVELSFGGDKVGFAGEAAIVLMSGKGLEAEFHYWKFKSGGFDLGAELTVSTTAGVITGPITWFKMGGGFSFNTAENKYSVKLKGDITNTGNRPEVMYVQAEIEILFEPNKECIADGLPPVTIDGSGKLFMKKEPWAEVKVKVDMCLGYFFLDINAKIPTIPGLAEITASGTIFAAANSSSGAGDACLFIGLNAHAELLDWASGNLTFALGVNVNRDRPYMTQEVKNYFAKIDSDAREKNGTYFNGVFIDIGIDFPEQKGSFDAVILSGYYKVWATAGGKFYLKFSNGDFKASIHVDGWAEGGGSIVGLKARGIVSLKADLSGGRYKSRPTDPQLWHVHGKVDAHAEFQIGDEDDCNDWTIGGPCCGHFCCRRPHWKSPGFKVCTDFNLEFWYHENESTPHISFD